MVQRAALSGCGLAWCWVVQVLQERRKSCVVSAAWGSQPFCPCVEMKVMVRGHCPWGLGDLRPRNVHRDPAHRPAAPQTIRAPQTCAHRRREIVPCWGAGQRGLAVKVGVRAQEGGSLLLPGEGGNEQLPCR